MSGNAELISLELAGALVGAFVVVVATRLARRPSECSGSVCRCAGRLDGQTALVTGASDGIGKQVALELARRGATVVVASRDIRKAEAAADEIRRLSAAGGGEGQPKVSARELDLASMASVRSFAADFCADYPRLNFLINNAGVGGMPKTITKDGHEMTFAVNHLGPFLLTNLLLDRLMASAPSRIVMVSSQAHEVCKLNMDDLMSERSCSSCFALYSRSKLANILFTRELARRLGGTGVSAFALHPGTVATNLTRSLPPALKQAANLLLTLFAKSAWQGAQPVLHCVLAPRISELSGAYFRECRLTQPAAQALDDETARGLWVASERLTGITCELPGQRPCTSS